MSLFYSDALAVSHLRLQDWIYLGVSILQAGIALFLLLLPKGLFRPPNRPWLAIWLNLTASLVGVLLTILKIHDFSPVVRTGILIIAGAGMAAIFAGFLWFCIRLWQNSQRSAGQQPAGRMNGGLANSSDTNVHLEREVRVLLADKHKIEAIRRVRELTGMGLKQAKDYVEALGVQPLR